MLTALRKHSKFIFLCAIITAVTLVRLYETQFEATIVDGFAVLFGAVFAAVLFINAFFTVIKKAGLDNTQRLLPLGIWISCFFLITAYTLWLSRLESSPNFLRFIDGNNLGFDEFSLKKDGRYVYQSASLLGSSYNYGTYSRRDSVITLSPNSARNAPPQLTLLIKPYDKQLSPAFTVRSLVYAINRNGKTRQFDSGYTGFRITELSAE